MRSTIHRALSPCTSELEKQKTSEDTISDSINHGIAFAELVSYIEDVRTETEVAPIFKMTDPVNL